MDVYNVGLVFETGSFEVAAVAMPGIPELLKSMGIKLGSLDLEGESKPKMIRLNR